MKSAAIYARVSSGRQKEEQTIRSQTAALEAAAKEQGYLVPSQWIFEDEGYSGAVLVRPVWTGFATWPRKARLRPFSSIHQTV